MLQFIIDYQRKHNKSPTDLQIADGMDLYISEVRKELNNLLNDGRLQYTFTLIEGKRIEVK